MDHERLPQLTLTERPTPCILLYDEPKELETKFGKSYLYNLSVGGVPMVYFASENTHKKIQLTGAMQHSEILLSKHIIGPKRSTIVVERKGQAKAQDIPGVPQTTPISDTRQKHIDSCFLIGKAVEIWIRMNAFDPTTYTVPNMRMELLSIAKDIHRALVMYEEKYYDKDFFERKESKKEIDVDDLPF